MNRLIIVLLCLTLTLVGISVPTASAASRLTTSAKTALVSCLQQEYLMRDAYQSILAKYPTLTAFGTVAADEVAMIGTLKKVFAKYRVAVPADAKAAAAETVASTVASVSIADAVAINLERSTAAVMTQLLQTTDNRDVLGAVELVKSTSMGLHTSAFTAEQAAVATPSTTPATPVQVTQRIVSFTPSQTAATLLTLLGDESVDVIELSGTYSLPYTVINIDRARPIVVRPVAGATVVFSGTRASPDPQFEFGDGGTAGSITMQGLIFDGYILGQQGIIQATICHDITLNDMVVRNSRANGTTSQPYNAWALYMGAVAGTIRPTDCTANRWVIEASARGMSALAVHGGSRITANGWSVSGAYFAVYASSSRGALTDFALDGWTISDTGAPEWGSLNVSVAIENTSGVYRNMHATGSGILKNVGTPKMTDGGGNSW
jgi:hypothetical protein